MEQTARLIVIAGVALLLAGLLMFGLSRLGVTRLPGDLVFRRGGVSCFVPLATSLLLSLILTIVFWLLRR
jgi:hypothetical protein